MVLRPCFSFDITVDLDVEDKKAGFQVGNPGTRLFSMRFKHRAALRTGMVTLLPQVRIPQHFTDRHSGGFHAPKKVDPS